MVHVKLLRRTASVFVLSILLTWSAVTFSQQSSQSTDSGATNAQSQPNTAAGKKDAADGNAFPADQSEAAARQQGQPSASPQSGATKSGSNASTSRKSSDSQNNPFPEAQSKAAAKADSGDAPSARPSQGYSSSDAKLPPTDLGQGDYRSHEKLDSFTRDQTQDGRIEDDLKVANLYMNNGNYRGALQRYQDAIQYDPQNDTALYGIANAMCKQNMTAEAMAHFKSYAKDNPQGKYAVKAEKMLAHPSKCMHNF